MNRLLEPLLLKPAADIPFKIALVGTEGEKQSYESLHRTTIDLATFLRLKCRLPSPSLIALAVSDLPLFTSLVLAAWANGDAVLPLDPRIRPFELDKMIRKISPNLLALDDSVISRLRLTLSESSGFEKLEGYLSKRIAELKPLSSSPNVSFFADLGDSATTALPSNAALVMYTSGSTSEPKGVVHSSEGVISNVNSILNYFPLREASTVGITLPLHYSYSLVGQILTSLAAKSCAVQIDSTFPSEYLKNLVQFKITVVSSVAFGLKKLLYAKDLLPNGLNLELISSAGMKFDRHIYDELKRVFPSTVFFDQYGFAEAGPRVSAISDQDSHFSGGSVGKPIKGVKLGLLNSDGVIQDSGSEGLLMVNTASAMICYLNEPEATKNSFRGDWLISGDYARITKDGYLYIAGRQRDFANVHGERISLLEIEDQIKNYPGVLDAAVISVDDQTFGSRIMAVIEAKSFDVNSLKNHLLRQLSPPKQPQEFLIVTEMPRSSSGKLLKSELVAKYGRSRQETD